MKDFKLPNYWYIKVTEENTEIVNEWKQKTNPNSFHAKDCPYVDTLGRDAGGWGSEISFNQFKKYVLKQDDMSEIIGYKLKDDCEKYREAALSIVPNSNYLRKISNFLKFPEPVHQDTIKQLKHAKVLDLWFEPIYKAKYELPVINGYSGRNEGEYVVYGNDCAWLSIFALRGVLEMSNNWEDKNVDIKDCSHNRTVKSIKLSSDVEITIDEIKQILEYIENK